MQRETRARVGTAPDKPEDGSPCNGCGVCCELEACHLSVHLLESSAAPCVALEHEDGRFWCGLVRSPGKYLGIPEALAQARLAAHIAASLAIGMGCNESNWAAEPPSELRRLVEALKRR